MRYFALWSNFKDRTIEVEYLELIKNVVGWN